MGAGGRPARPGRAARVAVRGPGAGARADPPRADARLPVHVLPRRGAAHGGRPGVDSAVRHQRAALRRCASVELRRVRISGAQAAVRHQRLRRDAPRSVGVGREASRREHGGCGPRPRIRRRRPARHRRGVRRPVPHPDARVRGDEHARRLVRPPRRRPDHGVDPGRGPRRASRQAGGERGGRGRREGAHARPPARLREADRRGRRHAADRRRSAADRPDRGSGRPRNVAEGDRAVDRPADPVVPAHARAPPPSGRGVRVRARGAQGRRRRQRRNAGDDPAHGRPRQRRRPVPAGEGGAGLGARAVHRRERASRTTASASSSASA